MSKGGLLTKQYVVLAVERITDCLQQSVILILSTSRQQFEPLETFFGATTRLLILDPFSRDIVPYHSIAP